MKKINNRTGVWVIIDKKTEIFEQLSEAFKNDNFKINAFVFKSILKWDEVFNDVHVCGSMKALLDFGITYKGREMTYTELRDRVSKEKPYSGDRYFIKYCYFTTSKQEK